MDLFTSFNLSLISVSGIVLISLATGFYMRSFQRKKGRRRILKLEDEMLRNHAKILSLEKNLSDLKRENNQLRSIQVRRNQESQWQ